MNFAINYSPEAAQLLHSGQIELDYFKTPPWPEMIAQAQLLRPVAVHFNLRTDGKRRDTDWATIESFLAITHTAYVNVHLNVYAQDMPHIPPDEAPTPAQQEQVIARMLADVQALIDHFGSQRIIAENVPFRSGANHNLRACVEPQAIGTVLEETQCGLLLDISHARISAHSLGMDAKTYIESLPTRLLRELHFTGLHHWGDHLQDHLAILEEDWPWLDWTLENIATERWGQAHLLAFEYGGTGEFFGRFSDPAVIREQVPRLHRLCHAADSL